MWARPWSVAIFQGGGLAVLAPVDSFRNLTRDGEAWPSPGRGAVSGGRTGAIEIGKRTSADVVHVVGRKPVGTQFFW